MKKTDLDPGIRDMVFAFMDAGFKTFTSCQGGPGHPFRHPTIGLKLIGDYAFMRHNIIRFLRSHDRFNFEISLINAYTRDNRRGRHWVYVEGIDLLSPKAREQAISRIQQQEAGLRERLRKKLRETLGHLNQED